MSNMNNPAFKKLYNEILEKKLKDYAVKLEAELNNMPNIVKGLDIVNTVASAEASMIPSGGILESVHRGNNLLDRLSGLGTAVKKGVKGLGIAAALSGALLGGISAGSMSVVVSDITQSAIKAKSLDIAIKNQNYKDNLAGAIYGKGKETYYFVNQVYKRKILPLIGGESSDITIKQVDLSSIKSESKLPNFKNTYDTTIGGIDTTYSSQILKLTGEGAPKFKARARGDTQPIKSSTGLVLTTFENLLPANVPHFISKKSGKLPMEYKDSSGVVGIDSAGNFFAGTYGEYKNRPDVVFTKMANNKIQSFSEVNGNQVYRQLKSFRLPTSAAEVNYFGENKELKQGTVNFIIAGDNPDKYGEYYGGRIVIKDPTSEDLYLVSGSFSEVKNAMIKLKGDAEYLDTWTLDNGTFVRGLESKDGNITADMQKAYDALNVGGGGSGLYAVD